MAEAEPAPPVQAMPVGAAITGARRTLEAAGCDAPRLDAELLLGAVLGVDRSRLIIDRDRPLSTAQAVGYAELVERRTAREPVAYILGRREFRRLTLSVDRRVLIPRPETELLVEAGRSLPAGWRVLDVGTGSGAVALALKDERPDLDVRGSDISEDALAVARANAARLGLDVRFARADLLDGERCDAVLANLPYVADGAAGSLAPEITDYEPASALFAGVDGLDVVRRLVAAVAAVPAGPAALLALEIGPEQAGEVSGLLRAAGFGAVKVRRDLSGRPRVVVGSR